MSEDKKIGYIRNIDPDLWKKLKQKAIREDKTIGQLMNELIENMED